MESAPKQLECNKISILITYDRMIKDPDIFILQKLARSYYNEFKDYIDMESILSLDSTALAPFMFERKEQNILKWVSIKEFDYDKNYKFLYKEFKEMYNESQELKMVKVVKSFLTSYCVDRILIYNETDDIRQRYDLSLLFGKSKLEYVTGPMDIILKNIPINIVYDWDARRVAKLNEFDEFDNIFFSVAAYGFNFEEERKDAIINIPTLKYNLSDRENVAFFKNMTFTKESFLKG